MLFPWPAILAVLLLLPCPAGAVGPQSFACSRTGPDVVVRLADLQPTVRATLRFKMADAGQPWNVTDSVLDPELPFQRLICAYPDSGDGFVVEWEYGGIAHGRSRTVFRRTGTAYVPQ